MERLKQQIEFIIEVDKLKQVFRRSLLIDKSRYENDAEHTWHLALMALILSEYAQERSIDLLRVIKMLLIHDLVEIDAGDTFAYDLKGYEDKEIREEAAAERIFGLLPEDQKQEVYQLWKEFETRETNEAKFAVAIDRLQPLLHNYYTQGSSWIKHGITSNMVRERTKHIAEGSSELWALVQDLIDDAVKQGYLAP